MTLKMSFKNLFKPLIRLSITVIVISFVMFAYAGGYSAKYLPGLIIILCIPVLPTVYLLIEYFFVTRNQSVEITEDAISVSSKKGSVHYLFTDLKLIKLFKSAGMEKGSFPYQTCEMYYHAEIIANDGKKIILTSVLAPGFDDALNKITGVSIDVTRTVYSTIFI